MEREERQNFINLLNSKLNNCPVLKSLAIAQACLESAFGTHSFYNNIYGIKCHDTNKYAGCRLGRTSEVIDGNYHNIRLAFQVYNSIDESIEDYCRLMNITRYRKVREAKNYLEATQAVKDCGYATSLSYVKSLRKLIINYELYEFDNEMNEEKLTKDFKWSEFWSGDIKKGYGSIEPPGEYLGNIQRCAEELQIVRDIIKVPIIITSGYRTPEWNKKVNGSKYSYHLRGMAVDSRPLRYPLFKYYSLLLRETEFNGYGYYRLNNFVHSDLRDNFIIFKY